MAKQEIEITKEEITRQLRANQEKMQNELIDKILDSVEFLLEKANRKDYEPTEHERQQFGKIYTIITNMNNWF